MILRYKGLSDIKGSLIAIQDVKDLVFDEAVDIYLDDGSSRRGRVIQIEGDKAIIQVFEGTRFMSLLNSQLHFTGKPIELALSPDILGRVFSGSGVPIDGFNDISADKYMDINGLPMNPVSRVYPQNYICTGISSIDALSTLIRGQKLPIFSGSGMKHNELAIQIAKQASLDGNENFAIVFAAMGIKNDVSSYFKNEFRNSGALDRVSMFINLSNDPVIERILTPRVALTAAEYLAFDLGYHVLVIMTDMTSYAEALREFSSSKGEIPGRKGYPGYLYSDFSSLYERAGMLKGKKGSVTQIPILTMPGDDITHPIPDLTGYITEGQIVLSRSLEREGIYPAIDILPSLSRLMKDGIGEKFTREDHASLADQLFASYAKVQEIRSLASVIGEDDLGEVDKTYLDFGKKFERYFLNQRENEKRSIEFTLDLGWKILSFLPVSELTRLKDEFIEKYYIKDKEDISFETECEFL